MIIRKTEKTIVLLLCLMLFGTASASDVETSLSRLESARRGITRAQLCESVAVLRAQIAPGDPAFWQRLGPIVLDNAVHRDVRVEVMKLVCEKADEQIASDILSTVTAWATDPASPGLPATGEAREKALAAREALVSGVVLEGLQHLEQVIGDQQPLLAFLVAVAADGRCSGKARHRCYTAIAENPAPIELRRAFAAELVQRLRAHNAWWALREILNVPSFPVSMALRRLCAIEVIAARRGGTSPPAGLLLDLLDASTFPALRHLVSASNAPAEFHHHAACVLAHLGDQGILPELEALRAAFAASDPPFSGRLEFLIWMINVQHPSSKLLDFIASSEDRDLWISVRRILAIRRAKELGLPQQSIRQAILTHINDFQDINDPPSLQRVIQLKQTGLDFGILQAADLPSVPEPPFIALRHHSHQEVGAFPECAPPSPPTQPSTPTSQPWQPNEANYEVFVQWMGTMNWEAIDPAECARSLKEKMCELDLVPPSDCQAP